MSPVPDRIFLTGFMGCGKSTVAPLLAGILGYSCIDLDDEVERRTGKSIPGIFALGGEQAFREVERAALYETAARHSVVVALGGGTVAQEGNFAFVRSAGLLVYLQVDIGTLFARLRTKTDRPMLPAAAGAPPDDERLRSVVARLLAEREPFYRRADVTVVPDPEGPGRTAELIARSIRGIRPRTPI